MATRVIMPTLGLTMEQGTIARWLKREGDPVERDELLFTVETDKATLDVPSPVGGVLARVLVPDGGTVPVLETIAIILAPDESLPEELLGPGGGAGTTQAAVGPDAADVVSPAAPSPPQPPNPGGRLTTPAPAAPAALFPASPPTPSGTIPTSAAPAVPGSAGVSPAPVAPAPAAAAPQTGPPPALGGLGGAVPAPPPAAPAPAVTPGSAGSPLGLGGAARRELGGGGAVPPARRGWPASPRARRVAAELGVNLAQVEGTGPEGRIVEADVRRAAAGQPGAPPSRVSPLAQRLALELGVNLAAVAGSGPGGRITREDVEAAARTAAPTVEPPRPAVPAAAAAPAAPGSAPVSPAPAAPPPAAPAPAPAAATTGPPPALGGAARRELGGGGAVPAAGRLATLSRLRRITAERMAASARTVARVTLFAEVDFAEAVRFRAQLAPEFERRYGARLTYDTMVARACALAMADQPGMNAHWTDEGPRLFEQVDVGVAVALPEGLTVPVVRDVARRPLWEIARTVNDLVSRAQEGRLGPEDFGGTFTITNLGMYGVEGFTPIVNAPEVGILGVGAIQRKPVEADGAVVVRERLTLSLAFDHRAIDGAPAAAFLARIRDTLEKPYILLT